MIRLVILSAVVACALGGSFTTSNDTFDERIIGGYPINIDQAPYQVSVLKYILTGHKPIFGMDQEIETEATFAERAIPYILLCGGSIINAWNVLTAAHCTQDFIDEYNLISIPMLIIRAGSSYVDTQGVIISVKSIDQHPKYDRKNYEFDVSILRLSSALSYNSNIQPVRLPYEGYTVPDGTLLFVTGWGLLSSQTGKYPRQLQAVSIPKISNAECKKYWPWESLITDRKICALYPRGGKAPCNGDSGGPATVGGKILMGVTSFGSEICGQLDFPAVFASVSNPEINSWIRKNTIHLG